MLHIKTKVSEKDYVCLMKEYILKQGSYKIILYALTALILIFTGLTVWTKNYTNIKILGFWWVMGISYWIMIPILILSRAKSIYKNTKLFHKEMSFDFLPEGLTWNTIDGSKTFLYHNISILSRKHGIILLCSVYHVLVIPYSSISTEQFDQLTTLPYTLKKNRLNKKYYYKYRVTS
ncbi:MAG: hypothetical protein ACRCTJ_05870 [Brevinema sp.]